MFNFLIGTFGYGQDVLKFSDFYDATGQKGKVNKP